MSTEKKIILGIGALSIILLLGGVFLLSGNKSQEQAAPQDQIIARDGLHWHPILEIYIKDKKQEIPPNIGIGTVHQEIHTHEDADEGILHMEMSGVVTKEETELGNFFKTWGKKFPNGEVKMLVNGKENFEYEKYQMKDKDKIEIRYE